LFVDDFNIDKLNIERAQTTTLFSTNLTHKESEEINIVIIIN